MSAMLLLALQLPLLEARLRLVSVALASCVGRLPFHCLPLTRERLLCLGSHRRLLKGLRCLAGSALGVFAGLLASAGSSPKNASFAHLRGLLPQGSNFAPAFLRAFA